MAVETTTTAASATFSARWPISTGMPILRSPVDAVAFRDVRTLHFVAQDVHHLGNAGHADAADPHEVDRADVRAGELHAARRVLHRQHHA
jgi:hypothetical protein